MSSIIKSGGEWDTELINNLIHPQIAEEILKIKLSSSHHNNSWIWSKDVKILVFKVLISYFIIYRGNLDVNLLWPKSKIPYGRNCDN